MLQTILDCETLRSRLSSYNAINTTPIQEFQKLIYLNGENCVRLNPASYNNNEELIQLDNRNWPQELSSANTIKSIIAAKYDNKTNQCSLQECNYLNREELIYSFESSINSCLILIKDCGIEFIFNSDGSLFKSTSFEHVIVDNGTNLFYFDSDLIAFQLFDENCGFSCVIYQRSADGYFRECSINEIRILHQLKRNGFVWKFSNLNSELLRSKEAAILTIENQINEVVLDSIEDLSQNLKDDDEIANWAVVRFGNYKFLSDRLKISAEIMGKVFAKYPDEFVFFPESQRFDRAMLIDLIDINPQLIDSFPKEMQKDSEIVIKAAALFPEAYAYNTAMIPEHLLTKRELMLKLISRNHEVLFRIGEKLLKDKSFFYDAVTRNVNCAPFFTKHFEYEEDWVELCLKKPEIILLNEILRSSRHFCIQMVSIQGILIKYFDDDFKKDLEIAKTALNQNHAAATFLPKEVVQSLMRNSKNVSDDDTLPF